MTRFRIILSGVIAMALLLPLPSLITAQVAPSGSWGPPPDALLQEMEGLNDDLRRLIDDWKKGKIGGNFAGPDSEHRAFIKRVKEIEARKLAIVEQYFDGPTYGSITWSRVFTKLDCVDSRMYLALGYDLTADRHRKHVPDFLETAKKCKQALEKDLQEAAASATPPPEALLQEMEGLSDDLRRLIAHWKQGKIGGNFAGPDSEHRAFIKRVKEIEARKLAIVEQYFDGPTYGSITWSRVFTKLDCVDSRMYLALGYDLTADRHRKHVPDFLETAKKCKQALENDLQEAAATPTPTPSRPTPAAGTPAPTPTAAQPSPTTAATPAPTTTAGQPTPMTTPSGGKPQGGPLGATLSPPNTSYAVSFTDPDGGSLTYDWSESSISCGTFTPGTASPDDDIPDNNARWSHPNGTGVGQCPHDQGTSHTGSIVVEVFDEDGHIVRCTYSGSESGQGPPCEEI